MDTSSRIRVTVAVTAGLVLGCHALAVGQTTWYVDDDNCPGPGSGTSEDPSGL